MLNPFNRRQLALTALIALCWLMLLSQGMAQDAPGAPAVVADGGSMDQQMMDLLTGKMGITSGFALAVVIFYAFKFLGHALGPGWLAHLISFIWRAKDKGERVPLDALVAKLTRARKLPQEELNEYFRRRLDEHRQRYGDRMAAIPSHRKARLIVVVSGRGGVGKSTISLGLLEFISEVMGTTLLVDFDMPNRGLTSTLAPKLPRIRPEGSILGLMADYLKQLRAPRPDASEPSSVEAGTAYTADDRIDGFQLSGTPVRTSAVNMARLDGQGKGAAMSLESAKARFLPSVVEGGRFLGSEVFTATEIEVAGFLENLKARVHQGIRHVILDCHGAHDLFMVGAIQAADDLVVVMTPEEGSFDGTYDLLNYALQLRPEQRVVTTTLLINNVAPWQTEAAKELEKFYQGKKIEGVPDDNRLLPDLVLAVDSSGDIRRCIGGYKFGSVSATPLWKTICHIGQQIIDSDNGTHQNDLPPPMAPDPKPKQEHPAAKPAPAEPTVSSKQSIVAK